MAIADISYHQGTIYWSKARKELDFVIFRASIGLNADIRFLDYARNCGLPYGAYHFVKAGTAQDARQEARVFVECANKAPTRPTIYFADIEYETQTKATTEAVCVAFLDELRALGCRRVGLYIGQTKYAWAGAAIGMCDAIWIPRYGKNTGEIPPEQYYPKYPCDLWQYTSRGRIAGVDGNIDLNVLWGDKPLEWFTRAPEETSKGSGSMFTNLMLAAYCERVYLARWVYWYGTCGFKCSQALYNSKREQYPKHYTSGRAEDYKADIAAVKTCSDCVGLIKSFFWKGGDIEAAYKYKANNCPDVSADGMIALCEKRGPFSTMPDIPGLVVHRSGHIGVYVGGGYVVEMRGFDYDCQRRKLEKGNWTEWGRLPANMLEYVDAPAAEPELTLGARTLKKGLKGADVKELQEQLLKLGYQLPAYGADGDYGSETQRAVAAFQSDQGLDDTGICDAATLKALKMALLPAPPAEEPDTPENGSAPAYVLIIEGTADKLRLIQGAYGGTLAQVDCVKVVDI